MLSPGCGSLPFRKTSLTRFGQSAVGSIPDGSQTLITEISAGTVQPSGGRFWEAICINAFHSTAGGARRDQTSLSESWEAWSPSTRRRPARGITDRPCIETIRVWPSFTAAGLPISSTFGLRSSSERAVSSLRERGSSGTPARASRQVSPAAWTNRARRCRHCLPPCRTATGLNGFLDLLPKVDALLCEHTKRACGIQQG